MISSNSAKLEKKVRKWKKRLKLAKKEYQQAKERKAAGLIIYKNRMEEARKKLKNFKAQLQAYERVTSVEQPYDNFTRIEGIGPKIEQVLRSSGIDTFRKLSRTRLNELRVILYSAGTGFNFHNPATWATQARLASAGRWEDLELLQAKVKSNRKSGSRRIIA